MNYECSIIDIWEVDHGVLFVGCVCTGSEVGVGGEVGFVVVFWMSKEVHFFMATKAIMNIKRAKRTPTIVQTMSVQLRSESGDLYNKYLFWVGP